MLEYLASKGLDDSTGALREVVATPQTAETQIGAPMITEIDTTTCPAPGQETLSEHLTPSRCLSRWRVARAQILGDHIPWKHGKDKTTDTTGPQQLIYDLYNDVEDISEVLAGPITKRAQAAPGKAQKKRKVGTAGTPLTHEQYYTTQWNDSIIPVSIINAYVCMGYTCLLYTSDAADE